MKYNNKKTLYDGIYFDSKKEMNYYKELKVKEAEGLISELELQKRFILQEGYIINGRKVRPLSYICDFSYKDAQGIIHIIDVKGFRTEVYKIKKKLFEYKYGIEIEEI